MKYSVLMSVYAGEKASNLSISLESMFLQTVPPDEIVLVEDGPLTEELYRVIEEKRDSYGVLKSVKLEVNSGLGAALNAGLNECENELVARMDSDDIAFPERMEKQLAYYEAHPETDLLSCVIAEFSNNTDNITSYRSVPLEQSSIAACARTRNPFNHVGMVFRKSKVLEAGGYKSDFLLVEDHELWVRMLQAGAVCTNLPDTLVYVRCGDDMHRRRKGRTKIQSLNKLYREMLDTGFITPGRFIYNTVCGCGLQLTPVWLHKLIYKILRRKKYAPVSEKPKKESPELIYVPSEEEEKEARGIILDIYRDVKRVCEKHGLTLILSGGSCLGAVRHSGYIPWDDDMDAVMPRADYERLKQVFDAELSERYALQVPNLEGHIASNTFMKVILKGGPRRTELLKQRFPGENGLWLDICPMDYCPKEKHKMILKGIGCNMLRYAAVSCFMFRFRNPAYRAFAVTGVKSAVAYYLRLTLGAVMSVKDYSYWYNLFDRVSQGSEETETVTFPSGIRHYLGEALPADTILPPAHGEFEGEDVLLPAKAHAYLRNLYGADYLTPIQTGAKHCFAKEDTK